MRVEEFAGLEFEFRAYEGDEPCRFEAEHEYPNALSVTVEDGLVRLQFRDRLSVDEASRRANEYLRSWQGDRLLQTGMQRRIFHCVGYVVPGRGRVARLGITATVTDPNLRENTEKHFPWRRADLEEDALIASLIMRYEDCRAGRERMTACGYLVLTALESAFQGRARMCQELLVGRKVADTLGELVSRVGDYTTARKMTKSGHHNRPLTC